MARKKMTRISEEEKLAAVKACLEGKTNPFQAGKALGVSRSLVYHWVQTYKMRGPEGLNLHKKQQVFSDEFKLKVVKEYLAGGKTLAAMQKKYNIAGTAILNDWIREYNRYGNFYGKFGGLRMTKGTEISFEDRLAVVEEYLSGKNSCMELAREYNVTYQQVHRWVKRFQEMGPAGLEDRRGQPTAQQTPRTPEEELKIRVAQLEHENYLLKVERDLLKKVDEFERGDR